jgi:hypothetical protein
MQHIFGKVLHIDENFRMCDAAVSEFSNPTRSVIDMVMSFARIARCAFARSPVLGRFRARDPRPPNFTSP